MQIIRKIQERSKEPPRDSSALQYATRSRPVAHCDAVQQLRDDIYDINLRVKYLEQKLKVPVSERE